VQRLELAHLSIERAPVATGPVEEERAPAGLPRLPVALSVERLAIEDLSLGRALLGTPARLNVLGEARADQNARVDISLVVERRDGTPGRLALTARYDPAAESLGLDLQFAEPAEGLVARLLALPEVPALSLALSGDGPLAQWRGTLTAEAQDLGEIAAEVTLSQSEEGLGVALAGKATFTPRDEALRRVLAGPTRFALDARWQDRGPVRIERLEAETAALALTATGRLDPETLDARIEANARLRDPGLLTLLTPGLSAEALNLTVVSDGPLLQPHLTLDAAVTALRLPPVALQRAQIQATFDPLRPLDAGPPQGRVTAAGRIEGLDAPTPPEVLALLRPSFDLRLDGSLDLAAGLLDLASYQVTGTAAQVSGSGTLALTNREFDAGATLVLDDLARFSALLGLDIAGASRIEARVTNTVANSTVSGSLDGRFSAFRVDEPVLQALLGPTPQLATGFALTSTGDLHLDALSVTGAGTQLSGDAILRDDFAALSAKYRAKVNDLAVLSKALGVTLSGTATIDGTAEGAPDNPVVAGRLETARGSLAGTPFDTAAARYAVRDPATHPTGRVSLTGVLPDLGEVAGESEFKLDETALSLSKIQLNAVQSTATGELVVPLDGAAIAGSLGLGSPDIGALLARVDLVGSGSLQGRLDLGPGQSGQAATLTAEVARPSLALGEGDVAAENLALKIAAEDLMGTPRATAEATLVDVSRGTLQLDTLRATGAGTIEAADFELAAKGDLEGPLDLAAAGHVALAPDATALEVARLEGEAFAQAIALRGPVTLRHGDNAFALSALDLAFGEARLTADASLDATKLSLAAELERLDLAALSAFGVPAAFTGRADGRIAIEGSRNAPHGEFSLAMTELRSAVLPEGPAMVLDLSGRWQTNRLLVDGELAGLPGDPARLTADLPLVLEAETLALRVPSEEGLRGQLDWQGDAAAVWPLVPVSGHRLEGNLALSLEASGRPAAPRLTGYAVLGDGEYENLESGTILKDLDVRLDLTGDRIVLSELSAGDGNGGRLTGSGAAEVDPVSDFPFAFTMEMRDFTAVRRDEVAAVASGRLGAEGNARAASLSARLETQSVELRIPEKLPPNVVELNVVETGGKETQLAAVAPTEAGEPPMELRLDVALAMPRRVFLRGRGLESEWSGRFAITGPAESPVIDGKLEIVRGQLTLLGKAFRLTRGQVMLPADAEVDPLLDLEAEHRGRSITVTARITGRASNPSFALSSVPEYPRDEIVSRLLFGKGAGELSAVEAAQLAAALAELSGVGGGGGAFMDRFRNLLGVDVLSLEAAKGGGAAPAIGAGKYLSDDIYVGVQKDVGSEAASVEVEVELTPNVSVQSGVESTGESDIGIEFKWDY